MKRFFFIQLALLSTSAFGAEDLCQALNLVNCDTVHKMTRRSSSKSVPSVSTAAQFNPANVSHDRGIGLETFYQPGNSLNFSFVTGTGRTGAALVSSKLENSFFGNHIPELPAKFYERKTDKKQYKSDKYSLALGGALFKQKNFGLDLGLMFKYSTDVKKLNPGGGVSMRLGPLTLGASVYQDDFFLKYSDLSQLRYGFDYLGLQGKDHYQETFWVRNFFGGLKISNFFIDAGTIQSYYDYYDEDVQVTIVSASLIVKRFLFSVARRSEKTPALKYEDRELIEKKMQNSYYGGVQYSLNKYIILGAHYNYYHLDELAGSLVIFF